MSRVPRIRFKGFEEDWEQRKLGDIFIYLRNNTLSREELNDEDGFAQSIHYGDVLIKYGECLNVSKELLPYIDNKNIVNKFKKFYIQNGDVIIADTAEDETVGKCIEISGIVDHNIISGLHTIPLRPVNKFAYGYLGFYLNSNSYHNQLKPLMQGIKVTSISKNLLKTTTLNYPSNIQEQKIIGRYFDALNHLITLHQRKLEKLKIIKKSMLENLFPQNEEKTPKIRFSGFTEDWEQRKLEDYLEVSEEKNLNNEYTKENVLSVSGDVGIVNQIEFQGRSFAGILVNNYGVVKTGYVVYTKSPLKNNPYGIIKANKGGDGIVSTLYAIYKPKVNVNSNFIQIYFEQNARMNNYMQPLVNKGAKNDMKISSENALKGNVIFPIRKEQDTIVDFFFKIDHLITLHQSKLEKLQKIKKSMLESMFV